MFENIGSHGDIMPLVAIAAELVRRGHRCQLLANERFRTEATARGISFFPSTPARTHGEIAKLAVAQLDASWCAKVLAASTRR